MTKDKSQEELHKLTELIKKLRAPDGCPWDQKQKKEDIGRYLLDEAYEVIDAINLDDSQLLREELGDLLFQILFLADLACENKQFCLADVMAGTREKMIRRHPHVFGDTKVKSAEEVKENWQQIKKKERGAQSAEQKLFGSVPRALPALKRAQKITAIAARHKFDWPDIKGVLDKFEEELAEFNDALKSNDKKKTEEELGDLLFTVVNLSRFLEIDPETALSRTTDKFLRRFSFVLRELARKKIPLEAATPEAMNVLWDEVKKREAEPQ